MATTEKYVGQPILRKEDPELITGRGTFVDNIARPGMLWVGIVRSPFAHARINSIDVSKARELPGVVAAQGIARLHAAGQDSVAEGSRFVGMFRAHGLLAPVWDLPLGTGAEVLEEPAAHFAADLADALKGGDLTPAERSARAGLANRQVTIR